VANLAQSRPLGGSSVGHGVVTFASPPMPDTAASSLSLPRVANTLDRLHKHARTDLFRIALVAPLVVPDFFGFRKVLDDRLSHRMRSVYVPVSRSQGQMLYLIARSIDARKIVEFGTSFGISTLYLAAAVKDNGGGVVVGSELEPSKHAKACEHLREAGLDAVTDVRLGDAMQTLADIEAPVDMVLLDGWKDTYLPILKLLQPKLRRRAVVLADNIFTFRRALRPYVDYVQRDGSGFVSGTLDIADGFELSVFTG
jgi:predicted O-methyltransferase YrrM